MNEIEKADEERRVEPEKVGETVVEEEIENINPIVATDGSESTEIESESENTQQESSPKDGFADYLNWFLVQPDMKVYQ